MKGLKSLTFDPMQFAPEERAAAWSKFFGNMSVTRTLPLPGRSFGSQATVWLAERVAFTHARSHVQTYEAEEAARIGMQKRDNLLAWTCTSGIGQYVHDGRIFSIRPGDVFILDSSKEVRAIMTEANMFSVVIPHSSVGYDPIHHPPNMLIRAFSPRAAAFRAWLMETISELPRARRSDAPEIALIAKQHMRSILMDPRRDLSADQVLSERITDFIDQHVFDEHLTPALLMETFELSRARLYALRGVPQSLDSYVADRRLEYALRSLTFGAVSPDRIPKIARLCGFEETADFCAAFEQRFQFSPNLVLGQLSHAELSPQTQETTDLWQRWLD